MDFYINAIQIVAVSVLIIAAWNNNIVKQV